MSSLISRYKWLALPLAFIVLLAAFSPLLLPQMARDLLSGTDQGSGTIIPMATPSLDQSSIEVGTVLHVCFDTPPLFSPTLAQQAAGAIASEIDALLVPGFSGLRFYSSYIASKSYQDETGVNFTIPPVPPLPPYPLQKHSPDPYQDALLKQDFAAHVDAWQKHVSLQLNQLAILRATVHRETNVLRSLTFGFDDRGADYYSCLSEGATHVQDTFSAQTKLLVLVSALVNNQPEQGQLSLTGVAVKALYFSCNESALACQARVSIIRHLVMASGAKSFSVFDVSESQAQHVLFSFPGGALCLT